MITGKSTEHYQHHHWTEYWALLASSLDRVLGIITGHNTWHSIGDHQHHHWTEYWTLSASSLDRALVIISVITGQSTGHYHWTQHREQQWRSSASSLDRLLGIRCGPDTGNSTGDHQHHHCSCCPCFHLLHFFSVFSWLNSDFFKFQEQEKEIKISQEIFLKEQVHEILTASFFLKITLIEM